ncbi:putative terpene synthase metal binding domain protein [Rosellinia necatrix]|uniref:Terpene synthase n=1 Tax=Rosellinia necatrix TaxID=77044 RepID=A0A1S7UNQ4_ROSNE|nr:putative terpene synthase metal binding domain protein [Rosellinia necatrix]
MAAVDIQRAPTELRVNGDPRADIIKQLKARPYYIPTLKPPFKDWPDAVSPHYPQLKKSLDARINALYPPERAAELIRGDYGLCSCLWWPRASLEKLETCTFWFVWLFTWDDEIDRSTSDLFKSLPDANKFRDESYHFVRYCLGVPNEETHKWNFKKYNQVMVFVNAIGYYMGCQQHEQGRKLDGVFPTPDQYWETRLGTSAVLSMLALNEYADEQCIPRWIMDHEHMTSIWRESNLNMSLSNDILSLKKEIKHGDIDSIVPILMYNRGFTVQEAIADTCVEIQKNVDRFDVAADALLKVVKEKEPEQYEEVDKYITGCRYELTGNLIWSLVSTRYGLGHLPRDAQEGIMVDPNV